MRCNSAGPEARLDWKSSNSVSHADLPSCCLQGIVGDLLCLNCFLFRRKVMALQVNFAISEALTKAIASMRETNEVRAVIAMIAKESVELVKSVLSTPEIEDDFAQVRDAVSSLEAAFIIMKRDEKLTLLTFTPEGVKPRVRMMYAASSSHLRQEAKIVGDQHIATPSEIVPALFGMKANDRTVLETPKEAIQREIRAAQDKEVAEAPQRVIAMQPVSTALTAEALEAVKAIGQGKAACSLAVDGSSLVLTAAFETDVAPAAIVGTLPADAPSFLVIQWSEDKRILAYVCPEECKPKVRMHYAAAKPSLVAQLKSNNILITRSVETSSRDSLLQSIEDALSAPINEGPSKAVEAPAPRTMMKGPRMFMPE